MMLAQFPTALGARILTKMLCAGNTLIAASNVAPINFSDL